MLTGSLFTSAAGMIAQSRATGVISTNIANATTTGYKKSDTAFSELVTSGKKASSYTPGSVGASRLLRTDLAGAVQQTSSTTDAAIIGNGFFAVRREDTPEREFLYTRNGQFNEDSQGILRNSAGFILYGLATDIDGNITGGTDTESLVPVDVGVFQTTLLSTTNINLGINLNAEEDQIDPHTFTPSQTLPITNQPAAFTRSVEVYDALGGAQDVTFEFRKIAGPMAHFTSNLGQPLDGADILTNPTGKTQNIVDGDTLNIVSGANSVTVTFRAGAANTAIDEALTASDMISVINDSNGGNAFNASISNQGRLVVKVLDPTATLDITASSANVLGVGGFNFIPDPVDADLIYAPEATLSANPAYPDQGDFPAFANTATPNAHGWWEVTVLTGDPTIDPAINPNPPLVSIRQGLMNFNGDGTLNASSGATSIDLTSPINFTNFNTDADGNPLAANAEDIGLSVNVSQFSQFAGDYNVIRADQNGSPLGQLTGTSIRQDGSVVAHFSNNLTRTIYQVPLATFNNPDGLNDITGTAFEQTASSGEVTISLVGTNGAGILAEASIEGSNVDLANEFGYLIVTQRAYSANSNVIQAVDEMTQTLTRLK